MIDEDLAWHDHCKTKTFEVYKFKFDLQPVSWRGMIIARQKGFPMSLMRK